MNAVDPYIARLIEVARAYYLEDQTQADIARSLGISRSQVSRYLTSARELGIVDIRIVAPEEASNTLGVLVKRRYPHLQEVIIAPTFSTDPAAIRAMIGRTAAKFLMEIVQPGQRLALGCGRTLREMVTALQKRNVPDVVVVQAMGNIGHEAHQIDYNEIARQAAEGVGGQVFYLSAPAILGAGSVSAREFVRVNPTLKHSLSLAKKADIYVVGLGSLESDQLYARVGLILDAELDMLKGRAVGDICGRFFDQEGNQQPALFDERIVGIELSDLRNAPYSIGVAGGQDKAAPLLGAIRGGYVNVVISDESTLHHLLELDER